MGIPSELSSFSKEELVAGKACYELLEQLPKVVPLEEERFREINCS